MGNYKGFYKVKESGGTYVVGTFYNPTTNEEFSVCTRDYDYEDGRRDIDELYYLRINEEAKVAWKHAYGAVTYGDLVIIVKGRKMVGMTKEIADMYVFIPEHCRSWKNKMAYAKKYLVFVDGTKVASENCELAQPYEKPIQVSYEDVKARME